MALQEDRNINRITIVGGGTSGYLSALFLGKTYPKKSITWIYPEDNNPIGVGEGLVPNVSEFLSGLGISHQDIIRNCKGTLKLGVKYVNFNNDGTFMFPFGVGEDENISRIMETHNIPDNIFEYKDISVHLRTTEALEYIGTLIENVNIIRMNVSTKQLEGTYNLLLDCTGFNRRFSSIENNWKSIDNIIPNNKALVYRTKYTDKETQFVPYTICRGMEYGWTWTIPLKDQLAMGYVYYDKYNVREEFISWVEKKMSIKVNPDDIDEIPMTTGRNKIHLQNNIVPIGLSSGFIEPLESTGLYLMTSSLEKLKEYIDNEITENQYNQSINTTFDGITDFIGAHYKFSNRDNEYWNMYKDIDINLYNEIDIFPKEAWDYILAGFGMAKRPKGHMNLNEMIKISRGTPYLEWYESNFK
jgi:tryptophan halogenase